MDVLFEMYLADESGAEKEQNEETKAAGARKKKADKDKARKKTHDVYRLWSSTEVHPNFQISLLQLS
jgi:hypothetical protein